MSHQPKYHKYISFLLMLLIALSIVTPALADYLGPQRTVTQTVSVCKIVLYECRHTDDDQWKDHIVDDWSCANESKPWQAYPGSGTCHVGDQGRKHWERDERLETVTATYPPATISGSLQNCTQQNGWCITPPNLVLTANEPVSGYNILLIEGSLNGNRFACPNGATSCDVPLSEGDNNFSYWALSSWGDSSAMGSSTARVDTVGPDVGLDVGGASGTNGWYVSPATITATGSDLTSGVASALLTTDGATWQASAILNEGIHNIAVQVIDNAGNVSNATTALAVDTTTPSIDLSVAGTMGSNGWYKSVIEVSAAAGDATSGLAAHEVSVDGAAYQPYTAPVSFGDGHHTIQFKAVDRAGNLTETPVQEFNIDTLAPTVKLPPAWSLEKTVVYTVQEDGSGLAALRVVIEDEDERYAKVAWNETVSGAAFSDHIHWDGVFRDKTVAPPGTYLVWVKAGDMAGNERFQLGQVSVPQPNVFVNLLPTEEPSLLVLPSPPAELFETGPVPPATPAPALGYGGAAAQPAETSTRSFSLAAGSAGGTAQSSSGVLWGAAAAAAIGAATAYALEAERKRKQEEAEQAARVSAAIAADQARREEKQLTKEEKAERAQTHDEKVKERKEQQEWANPAKEKALLKEQEERDLAYQQQALKQGQNKYPLHIDLKVERMEAEEGAAQRANAFKKFQESLRKTINQDKRTDRKDELAQEALSAYTAKPEDWKPAYDRYMAQKALTEAQQKQEESSAPEQKTWWQKTWEGASNITDKVLRWVDKNQTAVAIGVGILAGVAVILTAGVAAPLAAVAIAALAAGVVTGAGTVGLNAYFGRPLGQNVLKNISIAAGTALLTIGAVTLLTNGIPALGKAVAAYCALNHTACARVEFAMNAFDKLEEAGLIVKGAIQTWRGDEAGAAETALEIQTEYIDGGIPGNSVAKELGEDAIEELAKYGDDAVDLVKLYGFDAAKIILAHGDDGIAILQKYGDDGFILLRKYGDKAVDLINAHGDMAVKVMNTVDPAHAQKLLETLHDDVIEDVMRQGPDALQALSGWSEKALSGNGIELALRAKKDAEVLADVRHLVSLGPLDPKYLTKEQQELMDRIVENSMYYGKNGKFVLGRWIDYGSGFIEYAQETSSAFYSPHPDVWNLLGKLENQADAAWSLNKQAVQIGIAKGLPFEYTLNDIPIDDIAKEKTAVRAIFSGKTDEVIKQILRSDYMPVRMKELQELQQAGYDLTFDEVTNSYILILP